MKTQPFKPSRMTAFLSLAIVAALVTLDTGHAAERPALGTGDKPTPALSPEQSEEMKSRIELAGAIVQNVSADARRKGLADSWRPALLSALYGVPSRALSTVAGATTLEEAYTQVQTSVAQARQTAAVAKSLGDAGASLVFTPITPCRFVDTRSVGGAVTNVPKIFSTLNGGTTYGGAIGCVLPSALYPAIAVNATVVVPSGAPGFLALIPANASPGGSSFLNWPTGGTPGLANAGVVALGADGFGGNGFQAYSGGNSAFLIVDLFGYFEVAHRAAQALDCTTTSNQLVALSGSQTITTNSSCPAGYQVTSANCFTADSALSLLGSGVNTINNFSACTWHNFSPSASGNTQNYATCCRTAGY